MNTNYENRAGHSVGSNAWFHSHFTQTKLGLRYEAGAMANGEER